ncbi:RNA-binding protein Prp24 [Amylocystis lapponica]|nr:RNA-binding protein Prp24 [Amylocystis lapponica]
MDEADALEALSEVLNKLTENPYDISLHAENVRLAYATRMDDQIHSALDMVTAFWAAGDNVWLPIIERRLQGTLESAEDLQAVLDLFDRAEQDYLSFNILQKHLEFLINQYERINTSEMKPAHLANLFSTEWTSAAISSVVSKGMGHLTKSHLLWDIRRDWEFELLQNATDRDKASLTDAVEAMLLERLQQPHSSSYSAYSSFTTNYKPPDQYEALLVKASKLRSQAVKSYEKREAFETSLEKAGFSLEAYAYYIAAERRKKPDLFVLGALYERAIAEADRRRFSGEAGAEDSLRAFWIGYVDFLRTQDADPDVRAATFRRALKSVPVSGEVWARYIRFLVEAYSRIEAIGPLQSDVEQLVPIILARAGYEKRRLEATQTAEAGFDVPVLILMDGLTKVNKASPSGDPRLRLEKYLSELLLDLADLPEQAIEMWEDATKRHKASYLTWTAYTDVLIKQARYDDARKVFSDIAMKNIDWPEAIWDTWLSFEQLHGTAEDIDDCLDRLDRAQIQVNARRAKEAEKAGYAAMQIASEQQEVADVIRSAHAQAAASEPVAMDVDTPQSGTKRKAEDDALPEDSKKAKMETKPAPLKRDRENCTVFVADLPMGVQEDELGALFKDCGAIREIKVTQLPNSLVATVEFNERDSVPAALTKDKKRVRGEEIAVHLAWQSTLYITNFPEKADDTFVRNLFAKYGTIFDVRWPSKKFKSTRRFCYLQFTSPSAAQAALELHRHEVEPGQLLNVLISNPERKKDRTDSDANDRELYVAGLSKFATKDDLEKLFKTYGTVKEVRMALTDDGHSRGFAFIEFEQEKDASAALAANNFELKKRRIAVTLADTRFRAKNRDPAQREEVRNRSLRIRNLPADTQEGLLQQVLEKLAPVKRVEVFTELNEADVEFENAADAGKLLLLSDPIMYNGKALELSAGGPGGPSASRPVAPSPSTGGMFVPRAAASRPRAGLGSKKRGVGASAAGTPSTSQPTKGSSQDDFRKMLSGGSSR